MGGYCGYLANMGGSRPEPMLYTFSKSPSTSGICSVEHLTEKMKTTIQRGLVLRKNKSCFPGNHQGDPTRAELHKSRPGRWPHCAVVGCSWPFLASPRLPGQVQHGCQESHFSSRPMFLLSHLPM
ncbi:uncharacterized protein LOC117095264 isoform X1 [Trachypithecus francoisi]|uniref:uncharacterized protein LOC117095264 isoform X1 n=1 Tax=Trachypithecus francoisi TaxID=54180 RepID=UPI00141BEAAE|nr:uncharacterized protein LOC117095264 isoform X1 [Trachypithecus francoisi]